MKNDDFDWGDDFLDGDIDFNDDFDSGGKKKGFIAGFTSGFLGGLVEHSVGSAEAITDNLKRILPKSYDTLFDDLTYYKLVKEEFVKEFKQENFENVKTLQNIAKIQSEKLSDNSKLKQKLNQFTEADFSHWENKSSGDIKEEALSYEDDKYLSFTEDVNRLIQGQDEAAATTVSGINQMSATVGGGIIAAVKTNNRGLLGIETGMRDLLNYQRTVQFKMDKTMLEIAAKSYVLDARFYKFSEKANQRIIEELKKISVSSAQSDFAKSSEAERLKQDARNALVGTVRTRVTGALGRLREKFSTANRKNAYDNAGEILSGLENLFSFDSGGGGFAEGAGNTVAAGLIASLPALLKTGPFRQLTDDIYNTLDKETQNRLESGYNKVKQFGNAASYLSSNAGGLLNYYARYWENLDVEPFLDYEDYVQYARSNNLKVLPKSIFRIYNSAPGRGIREGINRTLEGLRTSKSSGSQYTLAARNSEKLTKVAQWREINNITLVDVIPGWLSKIYESQERARTGNDDYKAPVFSYARGQFIDRKTAVKIVKSDIFEHSGFNITADTAKDIVRRIDTEKVLTDEQIAEFALKIIRNADEEYGFNPFQYVGEIEGVSPELQQAINQIVKNRFGITDDKLNEYNSASILDKLKMNTLGFEGEQGEALVKIARDVNRLKDIIPDISSRIDSNREAGNEDLLRELGLIYTKDNTDKVATDIIWNRLKAYLSSSDTREFQADFSNVSASDAGPTRGLGSGKITNINRTDFSGVTAGIEGLTETLKSELMKLDFSNIKFDLEGMPDKFDTLNKTADEQKTLLSKISECVCRSAGGWGNKTPNEKERITRDENEGKRSLLEKIKSFSPKGFFNRSIEVLAENSPLVLTGLAAGLAGYAFKDPRAAALIAGGVTVGYLYSKLRDLGGGSEPNDDEDIYNENGDVLLYASKLRHGDYWDATTKAVLKTWKDIKGAVYDAANKTYVTFSQLSGKLFGPDNRRRVIAGLSKARDFAKAVFNKIDISGTFGKLKDLARNAIYQQDVYVSGENEPRLTRNGFKNKRYYCLNASTRQPFVLTGWNEIEGPVYELDADDTLTQIISEGEIAQGLVTSSGMKLDSLKEKLSWVKDKASLGLGKLFGYAKERAGIGANKIKSAITADYSSIEMRLDRIYYLLCDQFGRPIQPLPNDGRTPRMSTDSAVSDAEKIEDPLAEGFKDSTTHFGERFDKSSDYPHKVRLNSFEDKEIKEEKEKRDAFYEDIHDIKGSLEEGFEGKDKDKKKKGIFGTILGIAGGALGLIKNFFTSPIKTMGKLIGMGIMSILKSPLRLVKLGSLLFKGVLGIGSPIFKLLRWGLGGILSSLTGGIISSISDALPGGAKRKRRRAAKDRLRRMNRNRGRNRRYGKGIWGGLIGGALAMTPFMSRGSDNSDDYDDYGDYDDGDDYESANGDNENNSYDDFDDSLFSPAGLVGAGYTGANVLSFGGGAATKAGEAIGRVAPTAGKLLGGAGKLASGVASKAFLPLALAQAGLSFSDTDEVSRIFDTSVINGKQRAAHAITDFLDLGGIVSGVTQGVGNALGLNTDNWDGAATRFLGGLLDNDIVNKLTESKLSYLVPGLNVLKLLGDFKTDTSSIQRKIRMAMYGVSDTEQPLAAILEQAERELTAQAKVTEGRVVIGKTTVVPALVRKLTQTNMPEAVLWVRSRFLPIFQLWLSAANILRYNSLDEMDRAEGPDVVKGVRKAENAVGMFEPHPYNVSVQFSSEYPIMNREQTDAKLKELNKELKNKYQEQDIDEEGNLDTKVVIRTAEEVKEGVPESDGLLDAFSAKINSAFTKLSLVGFSEPKEVVQIDISDLHPGGGKPMDTLTMVRLGAYGNTESSPVKVDAVLKLERYCEMFFKIQNDVPVFQKETKEIFALFKNSFVLAYNWYEHWEKWFTDRFLPVLKTWVREVYKRTRKMPKEGWMGLSATNRSDIGHALADTKVEIKKKATSIWSIEASPFPETVSGTDAATVKRFLQDLDSKRAEKALKDPTVENLASGGMPKPRKLSKEQLDRLYRGNTNLDSTTSSGSGSSSTSNWGVGVPQSGSQVNYNQNTLPDYSSGAYGKIDSGGDANYVPDSTSKGKEGFTITPREAKKVILNEFLKAGYNDPLTLAFALANAEKETNFTKNVEDLHYRAEKLLDFPAFRKNPELAQKYGITKDHGANPKMIARIAYGRGITAKGLGNLNEDDGEKYIGRGFTQITGRWNYDAVGKKVNEDFINHPERVGNDPIAAAKANIGYFRVRGVDKALARGDVAEAARLINPAGTKVQGEKVAVTQKYLRELKSGELKNILDEITAGGAKTSEDFTAEGESAAPEPLSSSPAPVEGLDGTNKVNVPSADSTDKSAPPITTPAVTTAPANPAPASSETTTDTQEDGRSTDVTKQPQQSSAPTPPPVATSPVVEKKATTEPSKSTQPPGITPVYDAAVTNAIDRLTKSLESVLTQSKRVSVASRN